MKPKKKKNKQTTYFIMECRGRAPIARVAMESDVADAPWMSGESVRSPATPLLYQIHPKHRGNLKAMYELSVPLMRKDLVKLLQQSGVQNLELFDAIIKDPKMKIEHTDYVAFNILGTIAALDLGQSQPMTQDSSNPGFASLGLDEEQIPSGALLFRLAESVNAIVVHREIKTRIEKAQVEGMIFYQPKDWSG